MSFVHGYATMLQATQKLHDIARSFPGRTFGGFGQVVNDMVLLLGHPH